MSQQPVHQAVSKKQYLAGVKHVIAVASGKGGVGKSTTTANLALALQSLGYCVGVLDADIYGPNQPHMLGATARPEVDDQQKMRPVMAHGLQTMSVGYLIDMNQPMVWRGPMVSKCLQQLLFDTVWQQVDYLLLDLPPGTGDIQLTLAQKVPMTGAVIVTTPQDIALLDARKGLEMFRKVEVPILGLIENMSTHVCTHCGHTDAIFGEVGGEQMALDCEVELLAKMPLDRQLREDADQGRPTVIADPEGPLAQKYRAVATRLVEKLDQQAGQGRTKFPNIVVE